jgi:hypothetical protein
MDEEAVEALGGRKAQNPWRAVREVLRNTGKNVGASLTELYAVVRESGLGYTPTILELAAELEALLQQAALTGGQELGEAVDILKGRARERGVASWKVALACIWLRHRKRRGLTIDELPTDADLEELLGDPEILDELAKQEPDGPWDIYSAQSEALRTLRHFGQSLVLLAEEAERLT